MPSALHMIVLTPCATFLIPENPEFSSTLLVPLGSLSKKPACFPTPIFFPFLLSSGLERNYLFFP